MRFLVGLSLCVVALFSNAEQIVINAGSSCKVVKLHGITSYTTSSHRSYELDLFLNTCHYLKSAFYNDKWYVDVSTKVISTNGSYSLQVVLNNEEHDKLLSALDYVEPVEE